MGYGDGKFRAMQKRNLAAARRRASRAGAEAGKELRWRREFPQEFDEDNEDGDEDEILLDYDPTTGEVYD